MNRKLLLSALCAVTLVSAVAQDFQQNGINYQILDNAAKTVTTASPSKTGTSANPDVTGKVVIPSKVMYGGQEYTVTEIGNYSFFHNEDITSITFPQTLTTIGLNAFSGCIGLTSLTIPENVQLINTRAFAECTNLEELTLEGPTKLGIFAFNQCTSLKTVTCYSTSVPATTGQTFSQTTYDTATLYVPDGSIGDYKDDKTTWGKFTNTLSLDGPFDCSVYLQPEETFDLSTLYAEYAPESYTSANQKIVTVTAGGLATAVSYGSTTISVAGNGSDLGTVTVYVGPSVTVENGSGVIYAHPVAYNSVPKLYVAAGGGYKLAGVTYDGEAVGDELVSAKGFYTPAEPIAANAVINVVLAEDPTSGPATGTSDIFTSSAVRIYVNGHTVTFENVPAGKAVKMTNVAGQVLFNGIATSMNVIDPGVYVVTIQDEPTTFKVLVR